MSWTDVAAYLLIIATWGHLTWRICRQERVTVALCKLAMHRGWLEDNERKEPTP